MTTYVLDEDELIELMRDFWSAGYDACVDKYRTYTTEELFERKKERGELKQYEYDYESSRET